MTVVGYSVYSWTRKQSMLYGMLVAEVSVLSDPPFLHQRGSGAQAWKERWRPLQWPGPTRPRRQHARNQPTNQPKRPRFIIGHRRTTVGQSKQLLLEHRLLTSPSDAVYCLISKPHVRFRSDTKQCQRVLRQCPIMDLMDKLIGLEKKKKKHKKKTH